MQRITRDIHYSHSEGVAILGMVAARADCIGRGCWEAVVGDRPGRGNHPRRTSGVGVGGGVGAGEDSSVCTAASARHLERGGVVC